jgi:geranylgeranyl pyrophosphate synthase
MTETVALGPELLAQQRAAIGASLVALCDRCLDMVSARIADAIRYSVLGEGKRMRGTLLMSAYAAAGLAMVPLAARCAADSALAMGLDESTTSAIVVALMRAAGGGGMIGGQLLDLEGEGRPLGLGDLEQIHRAKTGALITAAATLGGRAARTTEIRLQALSTYGAAVGLAFQIADDVLDVTATTDQLGKTAGRDLALQKSTYPAVLGIEGAKSRADALIREGCDALESVGLLTPALAHIARFTVERTS